MIKPGIVVDHFACAGGASKGIEAALGRPVDYAINHNAKALAVHQANHPRTVHIREDMRTLDPLSVGPGQPIELGWFSPDCTYHSNARGGKPFRDRNRARRVRGLAWSVIHWAKLRRPARIMLENVVEFADWGPLLANGTRCPIRRGMTFRRWHRQLENLRYQVDMRELRACDYGAPTLRKRLFVIARCDGGEIVFPEATHGHGLLSYRTAADCIDWSIPCPSIFEPGRDLCENTLRRIARGVQRYVINDPNPFVVTARGTEAAHLASSARPIDEPLRTVSAGRGVHHSLVAATLINTRNGERLGQAPRVRDIREPYPTVTAQGSQGALVTAFLARHYGGHENDGQSLRLPLHTITTKDHHSLVYAFLLKYYGTDQNPRLDQPLHTITTKDRFAIVMVRGEPHYIADIGMRGLVPRELARATSFEDSYILDPIYEGKPLSKADQTWMIGNAVPPAVAEALVRANFEQQQSRQVA
jgi:DNA (cytosine-5)-methyltransferase 1